MKVGVIGCGSIGKRYVQWLSALGVEVAACDINADKLDETANYAEQTFTNLNDLIDWGINKLIVSTPPLFHAKSAIVALENGIDLLVEKPLAANLASAEKIIAAVEKNRASAWVVCNMRFHPGIQVMATNLQKIGKPLCVRAYFSHHLSQMRPAGVDVYAASTEEGGGVILDCIHELDVMQWLLGPMKSIRGWSSQIGEENINADDVADLQIEFASGCHGIAHFDFLSRLKRRGLEIIGNEATAIWESTGRNPEMCTVKIGTNENSHVLLRDENVNGFAPYKEMLVRFLDNGGGLQTINEAMQTLRFALAGASPDWGNK